MVGLVYAQRLLLIFSEHWDHCLDEKFFKVWVDFSVCLNFLFYMVQFALQGIDFVEFISVLLQFQLHLGDVTFGP